MPDLVAPLDETLPRDRDTAASWPNMLRELRALYNGLIGQEFNVLTDALGSGKSGRMSVEYIGQDDNGDDIWTLKITTLPPA